MINKKILLLFFSILLFSSCQKKTFFYNEGEIFGTFYHIQYQSTEDLGNSIFDVLNSVNQSLSTYDQESVLSKVNQNREVELDQHFLTVFRRGQEVSEQTNGDFDMTVTSLVNVWGFGFRSLAFPDSSTIDSLMQFVGYQNISLANGKIVKSNPNYMLDASAIAKGYGVDVVANFLEENGVNNYLVEIGGEIRLKGHNSKHEKWTVGIDNPKDEAYNTTNEIQEIISLDHGAIATSGNYRQYYYKDGQKFSHTINPKTGYPVSHGILSATVYAKDCMSADAYATSFMVMGVEKTQAFLKGHPELSAYLIYAKDSTSNEVWMSKDFEPLIKK